MPRITHDLERISLNLARLKKGGENFEIPIDPDLAIDFRHGKPINISEIIKAGQIFTDAKKGLLASETRMKALFGTSDPLEVAKTILKQGEIQLTTEYRQKLREQKKKKIIELIHKNGIDPRTKAPHPLTRIENAFQEAKVPIDEFKSPEDQIPSILEKLRPLLPIRFEKKKIQLLIPPQHAAKSYSLVKSQGQILKEEWKNDGSWQVTIEIPGGLEQEFYDRLNKITHGEMESRTL